MGIEIERKFLAEPSFRHAASEVTLIRQAYLCLDKERTVRVRVAGQQAFVTIKGKTTGLSRLEFEYGIPTADAEQMIALCLGHSIEKRRYSILYGGITWEVDEFSGVNQGLVVAEVELSDESQQIDYPPWVGREVSHDARYFNSYLATHPYSMWTDHKR